MARPTIESTTSEKLLSICAKPTSRIFGRKSFKQAFALIILGVLITSQSGCQIFHRFRSEQSSAPIVYNQPPSQQDLFQKLTNDAKKVRQLKTSVKVSMDGMPSLKGNLVLERPKRLRLKAGLMGVSEMGVDVGSNDQHFWIWSKASLPGQPPSMMYASHTAYENSAVRAAIPLEPSWLIDALGLIEFDPKDVHRGPFARAVDGRFEIQSFRQTPSGQQVRVTIVDPRGWVAQQSIYQNGKLLAYADSIKHKLYTDPGVYLPQRIELHVFQPDGSETKLNVDSGEYSINALYGDPNILWAMPDPADVPRIDITRVSPQQRAGQQAAGGYLPSPLRQNPNLPNRRQNRFVR